MTLRSAATEDDSESVRILFSDLMLRYRGTMPATIIALKTNDAGEVFAADVQPVITQRQLQEDNTTISVNLPVLTDLPLGCLYSKALGYSVTIPFSVGDDCIITCADRSIDNWQWFGGNQEVVEPFSPRNYDVNDAIVMTGVITRVSGIANYSNNAIQIRNRDATTVLSVRDGEVRGSVGTSNVTVSASEVRGTVGSSNVNVSGSSITSTVGAATHTVSAASIISSIGGTPLLALTSAGATFGVPITLSTGISLNSHGHNQGVDSDGDVQQPVGPPT